MEKVPVYEVDIEGTNDEGQPLGVDMIAFTSRPAIKVKGVAFEAETKQFFSDNVKYRIAAPAMIPMEIYRKADEDMGEHYVKFTEDEIEKIYSRFMENLTNRDLFNLEHNAEKKVPAYILEAWLVENPKQDKSYSTFGIECPKGTLFVVSQVTDPAYYESLVANGQVGYSVEGFLGLKMSEQKPNYADVIVLDGDKSLMLKRKDNDTFEPSVWGFAGGKIEGDETLERAAIRELAEETGLAYDELMPVDSIDNGDGTTSFYFVADYKKNSGSLLLSAEHITHKFVTTEELASMDVILKQNQRFIDVINKAKNMSKKITLPDGEHKIGKMIYTVVNGEFTEVKEEEMAETAAPTEEEKPTEDAPAEEVAAAETPAPEGETSGALTDAQKAEIMALIKPMIDELTSIIAETKQLAEGEPAVEEEIKEPAKTEMSAHEKFMAFYENTIVKSETEK
jgi:ADP-ribose pyrophosphatase YjhB (NUDIX family)